jgi:hypothetical protein
MILKMLLFERVEAMEYEVVEVKMPKGMVPAGYELIVCENDVVGDIVLSKFIAKWIGHWLVARRKILKPDWTPPKLKKGWLTWDDNGGWWWWPFEPQHDEQHGWVDPWKGGGGDGQEIAEVMAEFFGCPCCDGFDERNCIWEVGE